MRVDLPGLDKALRDLASLDDVMVTAGLQGSAVSGESTGGELVEIATAHEYGLGVPERPFLSRSVLRYGYDWVGLWDGVVVDTVAGDFMPASNRLRILGTVMVGHIQATIVDGPWTPNSPETIERKGSDRPLVDTGQMRQSIRAQVQMPGRAPKVVA